MEKADGSQTAVGWEVASGRIRHLFEKAGRRERARAGGER